MDRAAHFFILSVIFLLCLLPVICSQSALEYIRVFSGNAITNMTIYKNRGGNKVYVLHFSTEHWSVLATDRLQRTTKLSRQNNCTWASNAGPYHADGSSVGLVVSQGEIRHESYGGVGFGLTEDNTQWVIGTPNRSDVPYLSEFVTGFDWLVRDGAMVNSTDTTGAVLAARTAIGVDDEGRLLLMIIDGCEKCFKRRGVNLNALAQEMILVGARYAVNMDGGGSTVLVHRHQVLSHPTCFDVPIQCERNVATAFCIRDANEEGTLSASLLSAQQEQVRFELQKVKKVNPDLFGPPPILKPKSSSRIAGSLNRNAPFGWHDKAKRCVFQLLPSRSLTNQYALSQDCVAKRSLFSQIHSQ